jgi:hypothetical protein
VRPEGLCKFKKLIHPTESRTRDLPTCSIVPQPLRYRVVLSPGNDWTPKSAWASLRREKYPVPIGNRMRILRPPSRCLVTILSLAVTSAGVTRGRRLSGLRRRLPAHSHEGRWARVCECLRPEAQDGRYGGWHKATCCDCHCHTPAVWMAMPCGCARY